MCGDEKELGVYKHIDFEEWFFWWDISVFMANWLADTSKLLLMKKKHVQIAKILPPCPLPHSVQMTTLLTLPFLRVVIFFEIILQTCWLNLEWMLAELSLKPSLLSTQSYSPGFSYNVNNLCDLIGNLSPPSRYNSLPVIFFA